MSRPNGHIDDARLEVSSPQVIHETIDGEVIIINLATGTYYSLKGSGADIWELVQQPAGSGESEIIDALDARYSAPRIRLEATVRSFLFELVQEGLVSPAPEGSDAGLAEFLEPNRGDDAQQAFEPPMLEKFTDMQDLVLLDPVHEVAEMGWPQRRDESTSPAS